MGMRQIDTSFAERILKKYSSLETYGLDEFSLVFYRENIPAIGASSNYYTDLILKLLVMYQNCERSGQKMNLNWNMLYKMISRQVSGLSREVERILRPMTKQSLQRTETVQKAIEELKRQREPFAAKSRQLRPLNGIGSARLKLHLYREREERINRRYVDEWFRCLTADESEQVWNELLLLSKGRVYTSAEFTQIQAKIYQAMKQIAEERNLQKELLVREIQLTERERLNRVERLNKEEQLNREERLGRVELLNKKEQLSRERRMVWKERLVREMQLVREEWQIWKKRLSKVGRADKEEHPHREEQAIMDKSPRNLQSLLSDVEVRTEHSINGANNRLVHLLDREPQALSLMIRQMLIQRGDSLAERTITSLFRKYEDRIFRRVQYRETEGTRLVSYILTMTERRFTEPGRAREAAKELMDILTQDFYIEEHELIWWKEKEEQSIREKENRIQAFIRLLETPKVMTVIRRRIIEADKEKQVQSALPAQFLLLREKDISAAWQDQWDDTRTELLLKQTGQEREIDENRKLLETLSKKVENQEKLVSELKRESGRANIPVQVNINQLTRQVVKKMEDDLRLEKMRRGLL